MQEEKILINGLEISYKEAGEGPALLILHGWGSNTERWNRVVELLAENKIKTVIPDLPGFGNSQKPPKIWGIDDYCQFVQEFANFLKLEKFYLLGHSFGGAIAVKSCLKFPEKIDKLFLVGAACFRRKAVKKRVFFVIAKLFKIFSFLPFYITMRKGIYRLIVRKSDYPFSEGIMKDIYLKIIKEDLSESLPQIQTPTVIIWGQNDDIKPLREAHLIKEKIKDSKLEIVPGIGHNPHSEAPEELVGVILKNLTA